MAAQCVARKLGLCVAPLVFVMPDSSSAQSTDLVSRTSSGVQAAMAGQAIISATGRFVLFMGQPNLTDPNDRGCEVWYLRDRELGITELVSRRPDGVAAACSPGSPTPRRLTTAAAISADGRYVLFDYAALNLVAGVTTQPYIRAYLLDRVANTVRVVGALNDPAIAASLSTDGRRALIYSDPDGSTPGSLQLVDIGTNTMRTIEVQSVVSDQYKLSGDGSRIVYHGRAPDTPPGADLQIYVYDIATDRHMLASVADDGGFLVAPNGAPVFRPAISGDGRVVAYESIASNQFPQVAKKIVARLVDQQRNVLVTRDNAGNPATPFLFQDSPSVSGDGSRIAFRSNATNLPGAGDGLPYFPQAYVYDLATARVTLASQTPTGRGAQYGASIESCEGPGLPFPCGSILNLTPSISADGRFVAFHSGGDDLIANDANGPGYDVYVHDLGSVSAGLPVPFAVPGASTRVLVLLGLLVFGAGLAYPVRALARSH